MGEIDAGLPTRILRQRTISMHDFCRRADPMAKDGPSITTHRVTSNRTTNGTFAAGQGMGCGSGWMNVCAMRFSRGRTKRTKPEQEHGSTLLEDGSTEVGKQTGRGHGDAD